MSRVLPQVAISAIILVVVMKTDMSRSLRSFKGFRGSKNRLRFQNGQTISVALHFGLLKDHGGS